MPPSEPFERPEAQLAPVPSDHTARRTADCEVHPLGGIWKVSLTAFRFSDPASKSNDYFDAADHLALEFISTANSDESTTVRVGPFPLHDFHPVSFELPLFVPGHVLVSLLPASGTRQLAFTSLPLSHENDPGFSTTFSLPLTLNHREGRVQPNAGLTLEGSATLISIDRQLGPEIAQILEHMGPGHKYAVVFSDPPKSSFRLTLNARGNGEWWALSVDNQAREHAGVPYCGGVKAGVASGVPDGTPKYNGKPLAVFLRAHGLRYLLPRLAEREQVLPALKVKVVTENRQSYQGYGKKVLRTRVELDGMEIRPWYNFGDWNVAYPAGNMTRRSEWDDTDDLTSIIQELEQLLNKEIGLWVDLPHRLMVLYGDEVTLNDISIRAMHVTIPIPEEHLAAFAHLPPATEIK